MHRVLALLLLIATVASAETVNNSRQLREALNTARPGDEIVIAPGSYQGNLYIKGPRGTPGSVITIRGADPANPPVIRGGNEVLHLTDPTHVVLQDLVLEGGKQNGLNIDDGGTFDTPAHHVTLRRVTVRNVGPEGNRDGIKLSGVTDFTLEAVRVTNWGKGGSAVDMVGCHRGLIVDGAFWLEDGQTSATGVQIKGGSAEITVRSCRFRNAGSRAVNIGGSTGRGYFRPYLPKEPTPPATRSEASKVVVEGCTFVGSEAPLAFVGVDGAVVRYNTIVEPTQWVMRILQETRGADIVPSRNGEFTRNLIVYRAADLQTAVNIGPHTAPETFKFADNYWFAEDTPGSSVPKLPTPETNAAGGRDPQWVEIGRPTKGVKEGSSAAAYGSHAFKSDGAPSGAMGQSSDP